jgi:hypothetical protein
VRAGSWDDQGVDAQAHLLAYDQVRQLEDAEVAAALAGARPY